LHDTVVHTLSGLSVQLETIRAYWDVEPETAKSMLESSMEATRTGLQETRRAIKALRASPLDDLGLVGAIQNLLDFAAQRGNLVIDSALPGGELFLPPNIEQALYRITQEAIENIIHHAQAKKIFARLQIQDKDINLLIQDDGIGFDPQVISFAGHYGLTGMRERAKLAGGELTILSQPQQGTKIQLVIKGCV
jgi:signal transduction histidine kinase